MTKTDYVKKRRWKKTSIEDCVSRQSLDNYIKKCRERLITAANNNRGNVSTDRKMKKTMKQNWGDKNCIDISGNFTQEDMEMTMKGKSWERNGISSSSNTKEYSKNQLY